ncbi:hypothetical protein RHDC3_00737 [Rhodocyclaceae bacterium]|nr:hypothetical protein RHDC3_00737 [Rhodocyclaceae bacterium]
MRALLGVLLKDLPRYLPALAGSDAGYLTLCNRLERLELAPDGSGYRCDWRWTSDLHAPKVLPVLGRQLMKRALADHPIRRLPQPEQHFTNPEVSFIIGHRGMARLPHLLAALESIAGQQGISFECIVVEQETESQLAGRLPSWVRHIHTPPPAADMPYCRSWAFNVGVKQARGSMLALHDNDILVPADYASLHLAKVREGYEVVNLKRFIFFMNEAETNAIFESGAEMTGATPVSIMQNAEGGGSIAITRDAFDCIGGMDESFIGWGGEDNEFWERAQTCKVWPYGCLPIVHLWHASQPGKYQGENPMLRHYRELSAVPVGERIGRLRNGIHGDEAGPAGYVVAVTEES